MNNYLTVTMSSPGIQNHEKTKDRVNRRGLESEDQRRTEFLYTRTGEQQRGEVEKDQGKSDMEKVRISSSAWPTIVQ